MDLFFQQLVNGLSLGALYALIAVGYTVVYGIVQLINFAHGEIFMIGAFGALATWMILASDGQHRSLLVLLPLMLLGGDRGLGRRRAAHWSGSPTVRCATRRGSRR